MEHIQDLLRKVETAMNQSPQGKVSIVSLPSPTLVAEVQQVLPLLPVQIQPLDISVSSYIPQSKLAQAEHFILDIVQWFGGTSGFPITGWWQGANGLVREEILKIQSFTNLQGLSTHLEAFLKNVYQLGRAIGEEAIAVEIGSTTGSLMLLIWMN